MTPFVEVLVGIPIALRLHYLFFLFVRESVGVSQVVEGSGRVLVTSVGEQRHPVGAPHRPMAAPTPLHALLAQLAGGIGKMGVLVAGGCFVVLTVRYGAR